jgi:molybdopterin converting factor small subunit
VKRDLIKVIINSSYAIGNTGPLISQFQDSDNMIMELENGTTVEGMLLLMPGVGSPERWDNIMLHVFVNEVIAGFDQVLKNDDIIDLHIPVSGG